MDTTENRGTKRDLENAQKHTRLPWHFSRKFRYVSDTNHKVIAEISPLVGFEANAAFIVRAVNNHDALVNALGQTKGALAVLRDMVKGSGTFNGREYIDLGIAVNNAIEAAGYALAAAKDTP